MKIGIITIHDSIINYGASLQSYALWQFLSSLSYDCEVINLLRPCHCQHIQSKKFKIASNVEEKNIFLNFVFTIRNKLRICKTSITNKKFTERIKLFEEFNQSVRYSQEYRSVDELFLNPPIYDIYISGSDQVWNPNMPFVNEPYFLTFAPKDAKRISYASSFGISKLPIEIKNRYKGYLLSYDKISVRENTGQRILKEILNKDVQIALDPTFLIDIDDWKNLAVSPRMSCDYLLVYMLNENEELINYAKRIAFEKGLALYLIMSSYSDQKRSGVKRIINAGPKEWLGWIREAKIIITNSFHGTVFSMLMGTPFYTYIKAPANGNDTGSRITTLLQMFSLENHCLDNQLEQSATDLSEITFDYSSFLKKLEIEKEISSGYLINAIEE